MPKDDAALHLRLHRVRIDDHAAIDRANHALDRHLALLHGDIDDDRAVADRACMTDTPRPLPLRHRACPQSAACADDVEHVQRARRLAEQIAPVFDGSTSRLGRGIRR